MQRKITLILLSVFLFGKILHAQPQPCEEPPTMTSICEDACIICDIDGFQGRHESTVPGIGPPDFCTIVQHNMQWIAFIAGSIDLTIEIAVSNCVLNGGLEVGIYQAIDCQDPMQVSECWGAMNAVNPGTSRSFSNTVPLEIGQYYYLVMDGAFGDNCDWQFSVVNGSTLVDPLDNSGNILGKQIVCPDLPWTYSVNFPSGATEFDWTVNGANLNINNDSIEYVFPSDGNYTVCVTSRNACDDAPPTCTVIQVESIPDTEIVDILCEGDSFMVANTVLYEGGFYEFNLQGADGCDSLIVVDLTELSTPTLNVDVDICDGDTLFVGTTPFTQTGIYQENLTSIFECDSVINLDLFVIVCNITSDDNPTPVICFGESSGRIDFNVVNGTAPFTYSWMDLNGTVSGSGNISATGEVITIDNIPRGTYLITIEDNFGNSDIIISEVTEPLPLGLDFVPSDLNGVNVSCEDSNDGSLQVIPAGGVPNYSYLWSINQSTAQIENLFAESYTVTVSDMVGCTIVGSFEMTSPPSLNVIGDFNNPVCDGPTTGSISVLQSSGGVAPYSYSLNNNTFTSNDIFENLTEGTYELQMMDANGCLTSISEILTAPQIPDIELGDNPSINLGETFTFNTAINNVILDEIIWTPDEDFDCMECLNPSFIPLNTGSYTLVVTSEDDCVDTDSITITVNKFRKFFAPTGFSPDQDGFNDYFTLYGSSEVAMIQKLTLFNRWGAVIFEGNELNSGIDTEGWDGTFNGKKVNPGVYAWIADILFIDGELISYSGDVTVVK